MYIAEINESSICPRKWEVMGEVGKTYFWLHQNKDIKKQEPRKMPKSKIQVGWQVAFSSPLHLIDMISPEPSPLHPRFISFSTYTFCFVIFFWCILSIHNLYKENPLTFLIML